MDDVAVALEHVDLLDLGDGLDVELLQGSLELLVVGSRPGRGALDLSPGGTLATDARHSAKLLQTLLDIGHVCSCEDGGIGQLGATVGDVRVCDGKGFG